MTREKREEAIKKLKEQQNEFNEHCIDYAGINEAYNMAIEALKQESCEDYNCISRQAVLNTLDKMDKALDTDRTVENYKKLLTECYKDLPPVIPTPKKKEGKWIQAPDMPNWYWCSECGCYRDSEHDEGLLKYCPNCGAKMEE